MAEEFMNINKYFLFDEGRDYLAIINKFYLTSNKMRKINFKKFYLYYDENLAKTIFHYAHETKVMKPKIKDDKVEKKDTKVDYLYFPKENMLDNDILMRYTYILNNLEPKFLNELFPHLEFKNKGNSLEEIGQNLFADFLESHLIELKIYTLKQVVSFILLIIYIITLKRKKLYFHFFEEIMKSKLIEQKCCLRKYIYFILYLLNENIKEKIAKKKNFLRELLIYKEIMNCIYSLNQKNIFNGYYPNGLLSDIIQNFNFYQNYYAALLKEYPIISEKNKAIFEELNNYQNDILEEGVDFKVFMQNNACEDKGAIKDEVLIGITEALEYKGVIQTTCKTCKFKIKPNLYFIHVPLDKSCSVGFYSLIFSYKNALKILKKNLDSADKSSFDEDYFNLCGNIIFYINYKYKEEGSNLLSRYIASSLT